MSVHTDLLALLATIAPDTDVYDGQVPQGVTTRRYYAVYNTGGMVLNRSICGPARAIQDRWSVVCVNNTPEGAALLANRAWRILDGQMLDGDLLRANYIGPIIEDRDDPSEYRWSQTVELTHTTKR